MKKTGIELIAIERKEHTEKHGFNKVHDKSHDYGNLALNAAILASPQVLYEVEDDFANKIEFRKLNVSEGWKLPSIAHKGNVIVDNCELSKAERIKQLTVAGALICAEIDRLNAIDENNNSCSEDNLKNNFYERYVGSYVKRFYAPFKEENIFKIYNFKIKYGMAHFIVESDGTNLEFDVEDCVIITNETPIVDDERVINVSDKSYKGWNPFTRENITQIDYDITKEE